MRIEDGKAQKTNGRDDASDSTDKPIGLGGVQYTGEINGVNPIRTDTADSTEKNSARNIERTHNTDSTTGKILERLQFLKSEFLDYVDAHQANLAAQLEESRQKKSQFLNVAEKLEQDIYDLISHQSENNGHK